MSCLTDKIQEHFRLYEVIKNDLQPYIEIYKKYDEDLIRTKKHPSIELQDDCIYLRWYESWNYGDYREYSLELSIKELENNPEDFEKLLKQKAKMQIQKIEEDKKREIEEQECRERKEYEKLKEKFG